MKDDSLYLLHISECLARIERYVAGGQEAFAESDLIQDAVIRNLQTMAESTQRLSDAAKSRRPEIEWRKIAGFRNVLAHDYLSVDLDKVWEIIERELPNLKRAIEAMRQENPPSV
jgi:uncharacterized protein with HEPN domain